MSICYGQKIPSADFEIQENYSLIVSCCGWIARLLKKGTVHQHHNKKKPQIKPACVARCRSIMITFDLELDKTEYNAGETAKGKLLASADKDLELVDLNFSIFGAEFISVSS